MKRVSVVHLRGDRVSPSMIGDDGSIAVAEAPEEFAGELRLRGAWVGGEAVSRQFREAYYHDLHALLRPLSSGWGATLPSLVRFILRSAGLFVATRTWNESELVLHLSELADGKGIDEVRLVTDNEAGLEYWSCLRSIADSIPIRALRLRETDGDGRLRRLDPRRRPHLRTRLQALQDLTFTQRARIQPLKTGPNIVLFSDGARNWQHLGPIYRQIAVSGGAGTVLTSRAPMAARLRREGVRVAFARPMSMPRGFRRELDEAIRSMPIGSDGLGIGSSDVASAAIRNLIAARLAAVARRVLSIRAAVLAIAERFPVTCFAHASDWEATGHAVTWAAREAGCRTALFPHGLIDASWPELTYFPPADLFLVWGDLMREGLDASSLSRSTSILPIGWPFFETMVMSEPSADSSGRMFSSDVAEPMVLVAFGRPSRVLQRSAFEASAKEVLDTAAARSDLRFVIKIHPSDTSGVWQAMASRRMYPNVEIVDHGDIYQLLNKATVVVTRHSTAGAEAIGAQKPVIVVDMSAAESAGTDADYVRLGAAYRVDAPGGLRKILAELESTGWTDDRLGESRHRYSERFLTRGPGTAAERAYAALAELSRDRATSSAEVA